MRTRRTYDEHQRQTRAAARIYKRLGSAAAKLERVGEDEYLDCTHVGELQDIVAKIEEVARRYRP